MTDPEYPDDVDELPDLVPDGLSGEKPDEDVTEDVAVDSATPGAATDVLRTPDEGVRGER